MKISDNIDLKKAINIVWFISAILFIIILILLVLFNESSLLKLTPICENKKIGGNCFLCGSTRAFFEIKKLNFLNAYNYNKGSIPAFIILTINFVTYLYYKNFKIKN